MTQRGHRGLSEWGRTWSEMCERLGSLVGVSGWVAFQAREQQVQRPRGWSVVVWSQEAMGSGEGRGEETGCRADRHQSFTASQIPGQHPGLHCYLVGLTAPCLFSECPGLGNLLRSCPTHGPWKESWVFALDERERWKVRTWLRDIIWCGFRGIRLISGWTAGCREHEGMSCWQMVPSKVNSRDTGCQEWLRSFPVLGPRL